MGYWSVLSSVDYMDANCDYLVAGSESAALDAAAAAVERRGRVAVDRPDPQTLTVRTVHHTPAWAFFNVLMPFVRKERVATITAAPGPSGTVLQVRGKLDTRAASQLRALRTAP